jgi:hypothetical protein
MIRVSRTALTKDMEDFYSKCLQKLDCQVFKLETEEAKISAIQAVQRVLREMAFRDGEDEALRIIRYPKRILLPMGLEGVEP